MIRSTSSMDKPVAAPRGVSRRLVLAYAAGALLIVGAVVSYPAVSRWAKADRSIELGRVRLGTVERGDLNRDISVQGRIVAAFHPRLFSPARGIVSLGVRAGDHVREGDLLATVDSPEMQSELQQERSTLLSLRSELGRQVILARQTNLENRQAVDLLTVKRDAAERELKRARLLHEQGLLNDAEYEKAQDELRVASLELEHDTEKVDLERDTLEFEVEDRRLQVSRQELVVRELERKVDELRIVAPFDGMVATVEVEDRDAVAINQAILTVVDLSRFEVEIRVPENYSDDVLPGTPAEIQYDEKTYLGEVTTLSPEVNQNQVEGRVAFAGDTPAGLKQNQRVTTRLVLDSRTDVLKVPRGPFLESGGGRKVYVVEDGLATLREITVGATSVSEVEILDGLAEGEQILLTDVTRFDGAQTVLIRE